MTGFWGRNSAIWLDWPYNFNLSQGLLDVLKDEILHVTLLG